MLIIIKFGLKIFNVPQKYLLCTVFKSYFRQEGEWRGAQQRPGRGHAPQPEEVPPSRLRAAVQTLEVEAEKEIREVRGDQQE